MRILFVINESSWHPGARAFLLAASGLRERGHEVIVAGKGDRPVLIRAMALGLSVIPFDPASSTARDTLQLRRELQQSPVDFIFVHTDAEAIMAGSALRQGWRKRAASPVIRRLPPFTAASQGRGARLASRLADQRVLYTTEADRAASAQGNGRPGAVAPLSVRPDEHDATEAVTRKALRAPAEGRLIVCVDDGANKERSYEVLRTLALLAPRHRDLHLAIIGTPRLDEMRMHGAALGINSIVTYLGARDDELAIIKAADVGWIAAEGDAAALAALDFMAARLPILARRSPVTSHYVADGSTGVLLFQPDPITTAAAVAAFFARPANRVTMGKAGRARLERDFPFDAMIRGYEAAIGATARGATQPA